MEPNTSLVKWVQKYSLRDGPQPIETGPITFIPVIPLTDLTELVEGLRGIRDNILTIPFNGCDCKNCHYYKEIQRLLTQLEAHRKGVA